MDVQVRHGHHVEGGARLIEHVESRIKDEFSRSAERITHAEVHFKDQNAHKGGEDDLQCMIELRPAGMKPIAVHAKAGNMDQALEHAIDKMHHLLEHTLAKQMGKKHIDKHAQVLDQAKEA